MKQKTRGKFITFQMTALYVIFSITGFAQSGRIVLPPAPEIPSSVSVEKDNSSCEKNPQEYIYIHVKKINDFVEELNKLGKCGYRLEKAAKLPLGVEDNVLELDVFGVVRLNSENKYEYNWFAATSPGEVVTNANQQGKNGFYLRQKMMFISGRCSQAAEKQKKDNDGLGGLGDLLNLSFGARGSVFIFERKNKTVEKIEYRVLDGAFKRGKAALAENQRIMNESIANGFRPVETFYLGSFDWFAVVMEKDNEIKPQGDYQLLTYNFSINKKLTELSEQGYEPIFVGFYFAILHRNYNQPLNLLYDSADNFEELGKKLPKWQQQEANYKVTGIADYDVGCDPYEGKLFFSMSKSQANSKAKETIYKVLRVSNFHERLYIKKEKNALWTDPPTPEMMEEFQTILKKGYVIRALFYQGEAMILFERP